MEWLSKTCNKAWSSGTLDFTSAQETKKAQYELLKRHMAVSSPSCSLHHPQVPADQPSSQSAAA